jgi:hypothetical protein
MSLILDGTNGLSDVDGSASTPAIRGTDTNTGIFFPAADTIAFAEGGAEVARFDSSGNLGIGTTTPVAKLDVRGILAIANSGASYWALDRNDSDGTLTFSDTTTERMRLDGSGNLLVNTTAVSTSNLNGTAIRTFTGGSYIEVAHNTSAISGNDYATFRYNGTNIGSIVQSGTTNVTYATSSDYRLKENIAPMTGALAKVSALKPCTYTWKTDGSDGQGFIAHELAEVVPDCVTGEKDAVDEDGNPKYQGIDTSFLVATLTAAIQELKAELDSVKAELATLKA